MLHLFVMGAVTFALTAQAQDVAPSAADLMDTPVSRINPPVRDFACREQNGQAFVAVFGKLQKAYYDRAAGVAKGPMPSTSVYDRHPVAVDPVVLHPALTDRFRKLLQTSGELLIGYHWIPGGNADNPPELDLIFARSQATGLTAVRYIIDSKNINADGLGASAVQIAKLDDSRTMPSLDGVSWEVACNEAQTGVVFARAQRQAIGRDGKVTTAFDPTDSFLTESGNAVTNLSTESVTKGNLGAQASILTQTTGMGLDTHSDNAGVGVQAMAGNQNIDGKNTTVNAGAQSVVYWGDDGKPARQNSIVFQVVHPVVSHHGETVGNFTWGAQEAINPEGPAFTKDGIYVYADLTVAGWPGEFRKSDWTKRTSQDKDGNMKEEWFHKNPDGTETVVPTKVWKQLVDHFPR